MNVSISLVFLAFSLLQMTLTVLLFLAFISLNRKTIQMLSERGSSPQRDDASQFEAKCKQHCLTSREREILRLLQQGLPYKIIAMELSISEHTVASHIKNMFVKVGATNKMELVGRVLG